MFEKEQLLLEPVPVTTLEAEYNSISRPFSFSCVVG
jgi:hypothetical protein